MSSELRWQVFFSVWTRFHRLVIFGPTKSFGATETYQSVPPTSQQEKQFATCSIFLLIQLYSMNLVLYNHHIFIHCFVLSLKDQTYTTDSRKPFLEIDVKGGERDHIKAYHQGERDHIKSLSPTKEKVLRGREYSRIPYIKGEKEIFKGERILKDPRCLMFKRRDATCLFGGKTCSYELIWIKFYSYPSALIFCFLSSPNIPCKIQGEQHT